ERARRRQREMEARGECLGLEQVLRAQEARDRRDAARDLAPMVPAPDAIVLDSTAKTLEQVVDEMEQRVRAAGRRPAGLSLSEGQWATGFALCGTRCAAATSWPA